MSALALAMVLGWASNPEGLATRLPPAPLALYSVAWRRVLVAPDVTPLLEEGGVAADTASGMVLCGTRDGWLHAFRRDGTLVWEFQAHGAFSAAPTVDGDTVYAGSSDGRVYALSLDDGKLRWSYDVGEEMGTRPVVGNGAVYAMSLQDTLVALDARTGVWKWIHRRESRGIERGFTIRGAAAAQLRGNLVYGAYSDGTVAALDAGNGQVRWERPVAPGGDYTDIDGLRVEGDRVYAAAYSGAALALDPETGASTWTFRAPQLYRIAGSKALIVAVGATQLHGLSPASGQTIWSVPLTGSPGATPVFAGKWLLVPAQEGGLLFVEPSTGRTLRTFDAGSGVSGEPGVDGSRVYVLSNGGSLYALDLK
jgi:outer membrane protein assembly factor BamB